MERDTNSAGPDVQLLGISDSTQLKFRHRHGHGHRAGIGQRLARGDCQSPAANPLPIPYQDNGALVPSPFSLLTTRADRQNGSKCLHSELVL